MITQTRETQFDPFGLNYVYIFLKENFRAYVLMTILFSFERFFASTLVYYCGLGEPVYVLFINS